MIKPAEYWIERLKLIEHPEGGFFRETYRSEENVTKDHLPSGFTGDRNFSTAIYFLLRSEDRSLFHRIRSDELWHFHYGTSLEIDILNHKGLTVAKLGPDPEKGESLQVIVPKESWFGARVVQPDSYTLSGCTVSPGFDFADFELADREKLSKLYPQHTETIRMLT